MNLSRHNYRRTTLIFDVLEELTAILPRYTQLSRILSVSPAPTELHSQENLITITPGEVNQYLGQEFDCIFFDARTDFDVNAFTAITGTLVGGGELVLNLSLQLANQLKHSKTVYQENQLTSPLLIRFVQKIQSSSDRHLRQATTIVNADWHAEQQQVIDKIKRCALGHAKRPLVITANRGRGKSACLGIAAADLLTQNNKQIIITAPRKANLKIFYQHAILQSLNQPKTKSTHDNSSNITDSIVFMAPDELLINKPEACLLIVDEAGAIPVQMLEKMVIHYNRVVFSTTVDGYEGNGRGFDIRFKSTLAKNFPQWRTTTLKQPMRWPINDPLEIALNDAFLLSCETERQLVPSPAKLDGVEFQSIKFQSIVKSKLYQDESLLRQVYCLLVDAHYQTRPSDLHRILFDQSLRVFVALYQKQVIATALVSIEGNLSGDQCQAVEQGKMRLPGHLLPQSLMAYQGDVRAGEFNFWRVMRIAVKPEYQRNKVACRLIIHIEKQAVNASVDILGASYSLTPDIVQFWYQSGFKCSRLALRKDSSTGSYPGEFMKLTSSAKAAAITSFKTALSRFEDAFYYSMTASYSAIEPAILLCIIQNQFDQQVNQPSEEIIADILRYTEKARSFEMVEWQLHQFTAWCLTQVQLEEKLPTSEKCLLLAKLLQNKPWQKVIKEFELSGKKQAKQAVRETITKLAILLASQ
jgi:tRNA(Met) cytidine acetyltransferase